MTAVGHLGRLDRVGDRWRLRFRTLVERLGPWAATIGPPADHEWSDGS